MIERVIKKYRGRKGYPITKKREAAVLLLMEECEDGQVNVIFERRAFGMKSQPGDICLPGGRVEEELPIDAALRECDEEIGIDKEDIEVIGELDYLVSPYGLIIYPFLGVKKGGEFNVNPNEVEELIKIPLQYFLDNEPVLYEMEIGPINNKDFPYELINGGKDYKFKKGIMNEYFYKYNQDIVIWGFTAAIIKKFVDNL
ncbi:NUDIX hydrolase [Oceanirhabdus seepicola]|uniref:CoA pyrophosphatase n=1 Tax=Oceanirhabdus seepicola TaxID=2828781 RepID=A0A9J6P4N8_9CLOT|nr:CoA pyrophosphatase [Oceanirhabdus seepicola]MCM1990592.1 CoA pyrophosphatase [Oceanirhabdus seepicola]